MKAAGDFPGLPVREETRFTAARGGGLAAASNFPLNPTPGIFAKLLARRHGGLVLFFATFLAISLLTRVALLIKAAHDVTWTLSLLAAFGWGLVYDLGAAAFASLPLIVLLTVLPARFFTNHWTKRLAHGAGLMILFLLMFGGVAEWTFWDEFGVRLNFIAVDYLVYTTEVIGNIRESYNLPLILSSVAAGAALGLWFVVRTGWPARWLGAEHEAAKARYLAGALWLAGAVGFGGALSSDWLPDFRNNFNRELGKNGPWSLFAAFWNNALEYDKFYTTLPVDEAFGIVRRELAHDRSVTLGKDLRDTLRLVNNPGPELRPNVIQITVESLSADFLSIFNRASSLTPNLAEIAGRGLVFDNFYATGTRTDRGMEALTLSLPPTPGRSTIKRPRNENMFTLGSVFHAKGYDTAFIYGGYGYFDNMNYFFGHNGYRVIDRNSPEADVTFANIWGACDEDLFRWTMREADASAAAGKPFHYFVMTTSNHRPYTFPEGKIDLPSKVSGRAGAVKYTDYAIGKFLREAESKPWFKNTVFVIVADHCAASAELSHSAHHLFARRPHCIRAHPDAHEPDGLCTDTARFAELDLPEPVLRPRHPANRPAASAHPRRHLPETRPVEGRRFYRAQPRAAADAIPLQPRKLWSYGAIPEPGISGRGGQLLPNRQLSLRTQPLPRPCHSCAPA